MKGRMVGKGLRIYPETPEAYHAIRKFVEAEKLEAFTYQLPEDREIKAVIRGMPADTPEEIIEDLLTVGIKVNECHAMTNRKTGLPMPLFLLTLPKNNINKDIFNMTELCYLKIKVEPLRPKIGPAQCFRCQGFFHSSKYCTRNPKCVKCGQPHLTRSCTKTSATEATCCNCQGNHPANYTGCPKNPLNKPPPPPKVNFWEERARKRREMQEAAKAQADAARPTTTSAPAYTPHQTSVGNLIPDLLKIFRNRSQCIIVGDFNAKHTSWSATPHNNPAGNAIVRLVRANGFLLTAPNGPTRVPTRGRPSTLDFGITCGINNITAEVHSDLSSDHNPVHFVISINSSIPFKQNCKTLTNWYKFQNIIATSLPGNPQISDNEEIEEAIVNFNTQIHNAINQASKFKPILHSISNIPFKPDSKSEKKTAYANFGKELNPLPQGEVNRLKNYSHRSEKLKGAYLGFPQKRRKYRHRHPPQARSRK
ncbi:nucleic-acid-binding protein from transposon X-element [Trichonephila clavipes]|nr:nucleic-acid-binding protein from transposon X-element [Trichonephila clavipes]